MFRLCLLAAALFALSACGHEEEAHGDEHDHAHDHGSHGEHGPHDGMIAKLKQSDGTPVGFVELKLHDDKGDLELWLADDEAMSKAFALPLDQVLEVAFLAPLNKKVELRARNAEQNEDEDGNTTVVDGKTNYFIFPSQEGEDATWLQGKDFEARVQVLFRFKDERYGSEPFQLVPHSH